MNATKNTKGLRIIYANVESSGADISPDICLYRDRTLALLRRYFRLSIELGRVPALLGREFFRSKVTSYRMHNFEDVVIFVHDVERCLEELDVFSRTLIARLALQEHTQAEAAKILGCTERTIERRYPEALDELSEILLRRRLLETSERKPRIRHSTDDAGLPPRKPAARVFACQEGKTAQFSASLSKLCR